MGLWKILTSLRAKSCLREVGGFCSASPKQSPGSPCHWGVGSLPGLLSFSDFNSSIKKEKRNWKHLGMSLMQRSNETVYRNHFLEEPSNLH